MFSALVREGGEGETAAAAAAAAAATHCVDNYYHFAVMKLYGV